MQKLVICVLLLFSWALAIRRLGLIDDNENMDNSFDISMDGDVSSLEVDSSLVNFPVTFVNGYNNDSLLLYWLDGQGESVFMGEISIGDQLVLNSYEQHAFTAKTKSGLGKVAPRVHTMNSKIAIYRFGPAGVPQSQSEKPFIRYLNTTSTAVSVKFRNLLPVAVDIWFEDGRGGSPQGFLDMGKEYTVNSFEGHVFFFTERGDKKKLVARHHVVQGAFLYTVEDKSRPPPAHLIEATERERVFSEEYLQRTGRLWRHYYGLNGPRPPPSLHMWEAAFVGQNHTVVSDEGYWHCFGNAVDCQSDEPVILNLTVISQAPKAFLINHFLSDTEVEAIIETAASKMSGSYVGNKDGGGERKSDTRTSRNGWVGRQSNAYTESLFRRAEHLLKVPKLDHTNTEDMQVVHYVNGQKYDAHHDWGVSGYPESRLITLLLYLTDMPSPTAGGETAFPKGGADGKGFKIHPGKGNAVLFYNLLEDGNGDDLALHAALPVLQGEKWLANFWVWDPRINK